MTKSVHVFNFLLKQKKHEINCCALSSRPYSIAKSYATKRGVWNAIIIEIPRLADLPLCTIWPQFVVPLCVYFPGHGGSSTFLIRRVVDRKWKVLMLGRRCDCDIETVALPVWHDAIPLGWQSTGTGAAGGWGGRGMGHRRGMGGGGGRGVRGGGVLGEGGGGGGGGGRDSLNLNRRGACAINSRPMRPFSAAARHSTDHSQRRRRRLNTGVSRVPLCLARTTDARPSR